MSDKGKKRKKQYYKQAAKRGKWSNALDAGMRGFFITCNNREREAVREAYNLFNEYADKLYGEEQKPEKIEDKGSSGADDEDDIEAALEKEVSELKSKEKHERRFQQVECGANNCIFIKTTLPDPTELVNSIFSDVYESETAKSRYIMRLLPVIGTCKCNEDKIKKLAEDVLKAHFTDAVGHTFSINIKVRNNNSFGKKEILPILLDVIRDLNPANHPDLDSPEYIVNVGIIRTVLCLSVLKDSVKFKKYNLQEVASAISATKAAAAKAATDDIAKQDKAYEKQEDVNKDSSDALPDSNSETLPKRDGAKTDDAGTKESTKQDKGKDKQEESVNANKDSTEPLPESNKKTTQECDGAAGEENAKMDDAGAKGSSDNEDNCTPDARNEKKTGGCTGEQEENDNI